MQGKKLLFFPRSHNYLGSKKLERELIRLNMYKFMQVCKKKKHPFY